MVRIEHMVTAGINLFLLRASDFTWLVVQRVSQQDEDNTEGNDSCPPGQQEHNNQTTNGSQQ